MLLKATNAQAAGASALIIFNQGNTPEREPLIIGTLAPFAALDPGGRRELRGRRSACAGRLQCDRDRRPGVATAGQRHRRDDWRERRQRRDGRSASRLRACRARGSTTTGRAPRRLLETALMMAKVQPQNTIRFAWWGAEEGGLSAPRPTSRASLRRSRTASAVPELRHGRLAELRLLRLRRRQLRRCRSAAGPTGSAAIEDVYEAYYTARGIPYKAHRLRRSVRLPVRSSPRASTSRRVVCSPGPRASRRRRRRPCGEALRVRRTTRATTPPATHSSARAAARAVPHLEEGPSRWKSTATSSHTHSSRSRSRPRP